MHVTGLLEPPSLGERPQRVKMRPRNRQLHLAPAQSRPLLHREVAALALQPHPYLARAILDEVALQDLDPPTRIQVRRERAY